MMYLGNRLAYVDFRIFKFRLMRVGSDRGSLVTIGGTTRGLRAPGILSGSSSLTSCRS